MPKEALCVKHEILFKEKKFQGFLSIRDFDFNEIILNNYFYAERTNEMEYDLSIMQIIPYILIVNKKENKVFAYKRVGKPVNQEGYFEERLKDKYSIGIGGHIERQDDENPIFSGMMRELTEEVTLNNPQVPKIIGYINDELGTIEKHHFAILYILDTEQEVKKGDDEMVSCAWYNINEFESLLEDPNNEFERWSQFAWPVAKEYLLSK